MTYAVDETHNPSRRSWVEGADGHPDFPLQNLPLGIFATEGSLPRVGVAIGDKILDTQAVRALLPEPAHAALGRDSLNAVLDLGPERRLELRHRLFELLAEESYRSEAEPALFGADLCRMHVPAKIGDYTDFYVGINHAMNVGALFRPDNPLLPNYKHVPIGYHGRASSIRESGAPVRRPLGQRKGAEDRVPTFGPTERLDYELELGIWVGPGNDLGEPIPIDDAERHIAGLCLLNDWSARDVQAWEYQPLGPFLAKNFHTTISPWVVTMEALAPFRIAQAPRPEGDPQPLPYLWNDADQKGGAFSVRLQAWLSTKAMKEQGLSPQQLSTGWASDMYWTVAQMVTHHTSNGCNLSPGDLLGSGTISARERSGFGSLLELTDGGRMPLRLQSGEIRAFLNDGDELLLTGRAEAPGYNTIGFGECRAAIEAAVR